jgi:hypothetical protein
MALSLALVFSTAQISSNINNKLLREQAQQQASSFADVLAQQMEDDTSEFYTAVTRLCDNGSSTVGKKCNLDLVVPDAYKSKRYGSVKVTLSKTDSPYATTYDPASDWQDYSSNADNGFVEDPIDYDVSVTVVVTMEQGIYATVTDTYERSMKYDYEYRLVTAAGEGEVYEPYKKASTDSAVYFKRTNTTDYLRDSSNNEVTLEYLSGKKGDLGGGNSLVRRRVADSGESEFTFKGRE